MAEASAAAATGTFKSRSCIICRQRKVRCDKQTPCGNCRRAQIPCTLPTAKKVPRWAARVQSLVTQDNTATHAQSDLHVPRERILNRVNELEATVRSLREQLEIARGASTTPKESTNGSASSPAIATPRTAESTSNENRNQMKTKPHGRMVQKDPNKSHYVSTAFWSRIDDELEGLRRDATAMAGSSSDQDSIMGGAIDETQELGSVGKRTQNSKSWMFAQSDVDRDSLLALLPPHSQIPFLLDVFQENFNSIYGIIHMPSQRTLCRDWRSKGMTRVSYSDLALAFATFYAAVVSMSEQDVLADLGATKSELSARLQHGLEQALTAADFLVTPNLATVQAMVIFLFLARRQETPKYIWMMVGLTARMAQFIGLQRDGEHFEHMSPFEAEMRRRLWWALCVLDMRAAEDQGTEFAIARDSFDTKLPANINTSDFNGRSQITPDAVDGITDSTFPRIGAGIACIARRLHFAGKRGELDSDINRQQMLAEVIGNFEREYLQHASSEDDPDFLIAISVARVVLAKLTLFVYTPVLFNTPAETDAIDLRTKLLIAAIELAEHNNALHTDPEAQKWLWQWESHVHWHAVVFVLLEVSRRRWSPLCERAWVAIHSRGMISDQPNHTKSSKVWLPVRALFSSAREHRKEEITRLRAEPDLALLLEAGEFGLQPPCITGLLRGADKVSDFRLQWRVLVGLPRTLESTPAFSNFSQDQPPQASPAATPFSADSVAQDEIGPDWAPFIYDDTLSDNTMLVESTLLPDISDIDWYSWLASTKTVEGAGNELQDTFVM